MDGVLRHGGHKAWSCNQSPRAVHCFADCVTVCFCLCAYLFCFSCCRLVEPIEFLRRATGRGLGAEEKLVKMDSKRRRKPGEEPSKVPTALQYTPLCVC